MNPNNQVTRIEIENHKPIRIGEDEKMKSKKIGEKNKLLWWWRRGSFAGRFAKASVLDLLGQRGSASMMAIVSSRYLATHFRRQRLAYVLLLLLLPLLPPPLFLQLSLPSLKNVKK
ncbi:hypothetical protein VNO80_00551 [Phaseolus coccineus]|uniref:Uncharacterized protein n=1 Tax=Phaseolus coccineus TaxID=3886 RepID=A0AAN9RR91_PHACN